MMLTGALRHVPLDIRGEVRHIVGKQMMLTGALRPGVWRRGESLDQVLESR